MAAGTVEFAERWAIINRLRVLEDGVDAAPAGATPLIHVHGFEHSGSYLLPTARLLATDYPTYVPDLPGYGRSMKPKTTLTIPELGHAMAAYMDAMELKRRILSATRWDASSSSNSPTPILIESIKRFSFLRQEAPTINRSIADCLNLRAIHSGSQSGCIRSPSLITSDSGC